MNEQMGDDSLASADESSVLIVNNSWRKNIPDIFIETSVVSNRTTSSPSSSSTTDDDTTEDGDFSFESSELFADMLDTIMEVTRHPQVNKRRRIARSPTMDVRQAFAVMFVNILNSFDSEKLTSFLGSFGNAQTQMVLQSNSRLFPTPSPAGPASTVVMAGPERIVQLCALSETVQPDRVVRINGLRMRSHKYSQSAVTRCTVDINYTQISAQPILRMIGANMGIPQQAPEVTTREVHLTAEYIFRIGDDRRISCVEFHVQEINYT